MSKKYPGVGEPRGKRRRDSTYGFPICYYVKQPGKRTTNDDRRRPTVYARNKKEAYEILLKMQKEEEEALSKPLAVKLRKDEASIPGFAEMYKKLHLPQLREGASRNDRISKVSNLVSYFDDPSLCHHDPPKLMEDISIADLDAFVLFRMRHQRIRGGGWREADTAPATVSLDMKVLKHMYTVALPRGLVTDAAYSRIDSYGKPRSGTTIPRPPRPGEEGDQSRSLTKDEVERLLCTAIIMGRENRRMYGHVFPVVFTALCTGIRKTALLALRIGQIDFDLRRVKKIIDKGATSRRNVPIPEHLDAVLRRVIEFQREAFGEDAEFLLCLRTGRPVKDIRGSFKTLLDRAEIEAPFTFHNLRDSFATWHENANQSGIIRLKMILGHSKSETTEKYIHMADEYVDSPESLSAISTKCGQLWIHDAHSWLD